jgi:hypothetical protein
MAGVELVQRYIQGGLLLRYAAQGISPEHAQARPGPGAWSLGELIVHLMDSDLVGADRIKRVIAEPGPTLLAYDENAWTQVLVPVPTPIEEAVEIFARNRAWVGRILGTLPDDAFARSGIHSETGRVTLAELVSKSIHHLDGHLRFLYGKRSNLGIAIDPRYIAVTH